ncbi:MAG: RNA-guided endonuclease InsQ/TnpB family protein, partial [Asgard group archaeon]
MYLVQKNHLRVNKAEYKILRQLTRLSKNLYNQTLFTLRKRYVENGKYLRYEEAYHLIKSIENYRMLPSQVAQQTMKIVDNNMKSFFGLLRTRKKGNYNGLIRSPNYLPKDGYFLCKFQKDMVKVEGERGDVVRLSLGRYFSKEIGVRYLRYKLPPLLVGKTIKEVRILPRCKGLYFEIEYVYLDEPEKPELDENKHMSIDLGLSNFTTCVSTNGTAFIIEGKGLKSFNRWWNKRKAKIQSVYDKQGIKMGKKMAKLFKKRKNVINNYMAQAVNYITKQCLSEKIGNIVIGELKEIKQNMNLGKKNNQNFHHLTYGLFKQKLKSKCEYYGIKYIEIHEAYTSQTC